jgi:putative flippase GtrA
MVGVVGVTFNYSIFFVLYNYFLMHYLAASASGFIAAILLAFLLNKKFTFKSSNERYTHKLALYFGVNLCSLALGLAALALFVEVMHINVYIANFLILGITAMSNFLGSKFVVFR